MQWADKGILLSIRKHGENSAVARIFSPEHGVYAGVIRAATSKTMRGMLQPGNVLNVIWQARLSEQLGTFKCELLEAHTALMMNDADKLAALSSACVLMESALPERHPYPKLYKIFEHFLDLLTQIPNPESRIPTSWPQDYVRLELAILSEAGFGLDLSRCAATGSTEKLVYVSPKSGRAVSAEAGKPYHDKMLPLPQFLLQALPLEGEREQNGKNPAEILAGMHLTGYFLDHWLLEPHKRKLPAVRRRLMEQLQTPNNDSRNV